MRSNSRILLSISALCIGALILIQLGGNHQPVVHGDMIVEGGGFTMLTMGGRPGARDQDAHSLILLDNHGGWMMAYELVGARPKRTIELLDGGPMERLFERGRFLPRPPAGP
ncbi:MAG: hypothetical protein CMJ40_05615 [Phycisphaerae bacterium]|nr:hypothetical protein [Phycisphaerae bacterium]